MAAGGEAFERAPRLHPGHLVLRQARLEQQDSALGARPEQSGGANEEPQRLLGGTHTRRKQLLIELEQNWISALKRNDVKFRYKV